MIQRSISKIINPRDEAGFLGDGHIARSIVNGEFVQTDPFIFLMDDMLDKKNNEPAGGRHPHAGFETVSLMIEGEFNEMLETMKKGDFQVMTAGSGIVHTETIYGPTNGRLLQMWLNLPKKDRKVTPRLQVLTAEQVPTIKKEGLYIRVYSGNIDGVQSPVQNYTPLIAAELEMNAGVSYSIRIPANFNSFFYVLQGSVEINGKEIYADQAAWLDLYDEATDSGLNITAGAGGLRMVFYAAKPTGEPIVSQGPFIADTPEEIKSLYAQFRHGEMQHISEAPAEQKIFY
ncbi:MAG: pirin family protein [Chitinophagaceae bacterium]|nr:MAG: pirin family protein [Chitinophagaceae bacterium]